VVCQLAKWLLFLARKMAYDAEMAVLATVLKRLRTSKLFAIPLQGTYGMTAESGQVTLFQW